MLDLGTNLWHRLIGDLARVGEGRRESGAFLLGTTHPRRIVTEYLLYSDVAPELQHIDYVVLQGKHMARVWDVCEQNGLAVAADIHTHPGAPIQSISDRQNPIVSLRGHVALIVPDFAIGDVSLSSIGFHEFLGAGRWSSYFGKNAASRIRLLE